MTERIDCGDSSCIMPGARRRYGGQHTNGGCRCHKEDVARAHEEIAAQLRGSPSWKRDMRDDQRAIEHLSAELVRVQKEREEWKQRAAEARDAAIEECAKLCEEASSSIAAGLPEKYDDEYAVAARDIRALKKGT